MIFVAVGHYSIKLNRLNDETSGVDIQCYETKVQCLCTEHNIDRCNVLRQGNCITMVPVLSALTGNEAY